MGHSCFCAIMRSLSPVNMHLLLRSMMGMRAMRRLDRFTRELARRYSMSTRTGAAYVMSRRRHSLGVTRLGEYLTSSSCSSMRVGRPTRMPV